MVTEDPPRHSRSPDEPVTIEGTAERIPEPDDNPAVPEGMAANSPAPQEPAETAAAGDADTRPLVTAEDELKAESAPEAATPQEAAEIPAENHSAETEATAAPDDAATKPIMTAEDEATTQGTRETARTSSPDPAPTWTRSQTEASPPPKQTSTAAMIAAGIFGGLVALACAGAMQYAGYLPGTAPAEPAVADTSALNAEIDALRQQIAALPAPASAPAADPALEQRLAALEDRLGPLQDALEKAQAGLAASTQTVQAALSGNDDLTTRIDAIEKKLAEPQNDGAVARTIAASALRAAIDRGGSFGVELDALASVSDANPAIEELRPLASGGVLSREALTERFPNVAFAMIDAVNQPGPDAGIGQRLLSSAMSIVRVRDVGDVEGTGIEAITARIEDRLKKGDLKAAAAEWAALPDPARAAGTAFKSALDDRIRAEDLLSAAMAATNKQN